MTTFPEDSPRSFREVAIILRQIRTDMQEIKDSQERTKNWIVGMVISVVGGIITALIVQGIT